MERLGGGDYGTVTAKANAGCGRPVCAKPDFNTDRSIQAAFTGQRTMAASDASSPDAAMMEPIGYAGTNPMAALIAGIL